MAEATLHSKPQFLETTQDWTGFDADQLDEEHIATRKAIEKRISMASGCRTYIDRAQARCRHPTVNSIRFGRFQCMVCGLVRHRTFGGRV